MAIGLFILLLCQYFNLKNFNEGSDILLSQKNQELRKKSTENNAFILSSFEELKKKDSINDSNKDILELKKRGIDLSVFRGQKPVFWTSNTINIRPQFYSSAVIQKHLGNYVTLIPYRHKNREFIFTYTLIQNPHSSFFGNGVGSIQRGHRFTLEQNPIENSIQAEIDGLPLFYLAVEKYSEPIFWSILFLVGLALFCIGIYKTFAGKKRPHTGAALIGLILIGSEYLFYKNHILWNLKSSMLFAPEIFASDWLAPNLGVLLFNVLLFFSTLLYLRFYLNCIEIPKRLVNKWVYGCFVLFSGIYAGVLYDYIGKLVNDSSLSFDFYQIFLINIYTIVALLIIFFGFLSFFSLLSFKRIFKDKHGSSRQGVVAIAIVLAFGINWFFSSLNIAIFSIITLAVFYFINLSKWNTNLRLASRIIIPCIMVSIIFHQVSEKKDIAYRDTIAAKLLLQNEKEPQVKLVKMESKISKDLGILDYYSCDDISKADFEARVRQVYFNTFSDNYETSIFDFDPYGNNYRGQNSYSYREIDTLFNSKMCKPVSKHFALVTNKKLKGSYLGKFEAYTDSSFFGTYYVLMKPILNSSPGKLSQLFNKSPIDALFSQNQYSYAIYSQNKLSRRFGSFNYNIEFTATKDYYYHNNYSHYVYKDNLNNKIIVSKPKRNWVQNISSFTLLVLCCLLVFVVYYLFLLSCRFFDKKNKVDKRRVLFLSFLKQNYKIPFWSKLYLSNKLQLYVVGVVFITFCVILVVTVQYFNNTYKNRQSKYLWDKSTEIANSISTQANIQAVFDRNENNILYDLSNYYNTDLNLFNPSGKLVFSSNSKIYDQDLIGRLMKPEVYKKLKQDKKSGLINKENLGSLNYIASYLSIFDNDLNLKGYINLPYFTNEQDLIREISNYSATLINLFVLVFALAAILAYIIGQQIIKPLDTIRRELSSIKLGNQYTPLKYKNNDEIGLLITEYNKMLAQLEDSTNKLAESERQGAWREMAKQVAHEIKNPLTPMRLSLQHLQLSIQRKDENLDEKVSRTSQLLIDQIESLSKMAEEFSSFAKMPEAKKGIIDIGEELNKTCELFSREKDISIRIDIPDKPVLVHADPQQIGRVFNNIIKNAIQAIPEEQEGIILATIKTSGSVAKINISDNGKGIPKELYPNIFSPNFSTKNSGMGLGLAMSKKMVEQFSGSIRFESKENKGTTFFIELPLHQN